MGRDGDLHTLRYDTLVLALGGVTYGFGIPGVEEHTVGMLRCTSRRARSREETKGGVGVGPSKRRAVASIGPAIYFTSLRLKSRWATTAKIDANVTR